MTWLKCNKGISREMVYELLDLCPDYAGKVSIYTSMKSSQLKLTFNKFNGISKKEYEELVGSIIFFLRSQEVVADFRLD